MTVREVLEQARANYDESPSHAPIGGTPAPGTVCVLSAVWRVTDPLRDRGLERDALEAIFEVVTEEGHDSVVQYNAEHSTEEVLAVFDRAIERVSA